VNPAKLKAPTPSAPNTVNGVKQVTPTVFPKPAGGNAKPSIAAPVGSVIKGKNGQPVGTVVKLPNGQKGVQPIVAPTPGKPGMVNGVKQVTPTVFPKPAGGNTKPVLHPNPVTQAVPTVKPGTVVHNSKGQPIGTVVNLPNGKQGIQPIAAPGATPQKPAGLKNPNQKPTVKPGTVVHNSKGQPIGTVVKLPNGQTAVQPIATPGATPQMPAKVTQVTPTVNPAKLKAPTPSAPNTVNGVKQVTPTVFPKPAGGNAKPSIAAPVGSVIKGKNGQPVGTVVKLPNGQKGVQPIVAPTPGKPGMVNGVKQVTPTVQPTTSTQGGGSGHTHSNVGQNGSHNNKASSTTNTHTAGQQIPPAKVVKPSMLDRVKNFFGIEGNQKKIIEPGIRNQEVESYRTNDKKEIEYKDTIKQDKKGEILTQDKNATKRHK
jgi:hypothetical protein